MTPLHRAGWFLRHASFVLLIYAVRTMGALLVGMSAGRAVSAITGGYPQSDGELFVGGGWMVVEVVNRLRSTLMGSMAVLAGMVAIALVPISMVASNMLLVSLSQQQRVSWWRAAAVALRQFGATTAVVVVFGMMQAAWIGLGYFTAELLADKLLGAMGRRGGDIAFVAILAVGFAFAWLVGVVRDLARSALIAERLDAPRAIVKGWSVARTRGVEAVSGAFWRCAANVCCVVWGVVIASQWATARGMNAFAILVVMQASVLGGVALQASWLSRAIELVRQR